MNMRLLISALILCLSLTQTVLAEPYNFSKKDLAIVIDDLGNNMEGTEDLLHLPINLTVAIMPFMSTTKKDAELAHHNGHQVIVHLPMEPKRGKKSWLGPGAITTDLSDEEIRKRVIAAIEDVPHAVGMNNHMGSKVSEDERVMRNIFEICKEKGMFYLDSKTSSKSVAKTLAEEMKVPFLENDLFFDDVYTITHISRQANLLANKLTELDEIIAIGHVGIPGPIVASVLEQYIPVYQDKANLVYLSDLIPEMKLIEKDYEVK